MPLAVSARFLGHIALARGELPRAAARFQEFANYDPTWRLQSVFARLLPDVAALAMAGGNPEQAARLFGATAALAVETGLSTGWPERELHERTSAAARQALGEAAFAAAYEYGTRLPQEQVLAEVKAVLAAAAALPAAGSSPDPASGTGLTRREREVLRLVAAGRSNREIADTLFVTVPTVKRHLTNILAKLGLPSRSAATAYAHTHGLV
ncbi:MAG TPA: response regulator transcription factor [Thermomicrobiaceae bacterium]|nr:response regulator transcription factor [Thermomicrobiaceae bacterium]